MTGTDYVMLDRDGVINEDSDAYIKTPDEWRPIPGSLEAIALLNRHNYRVVVITNQSGIARGLFDIATLDAIHDKMHRLVDQSGGRIEAVYFCPHGPDDHCDCRKPKTGLMTRFAQEKHIGLTGVPAIGDSRRDIQAAQSVGANPLLVETGKGKITRVQLDEHTIPIFKNLYAAAEFIVSRK